MHIGMIYSENRPFPPDIRVEKEVKALCAKGHRISLLAPRVPSNAKQEEKLYNDQVTIRRVHIDKPNLYGRLSQIFLLEYPNWIHHLSGFIAQYSPEVLHVHDLYLLPTSLQVGRSAGLPVIADLHENMPAARKAYRSGLKPLKKLVYAVAFNYTIWRWHEARALRKCAKCIVVVPEAAERLFLYGIPKDRIVIVSNTEDETTFTVNPESIDPEIVEKYRLRWIVCYVGGIGPHRGIDTAIRAIPQAAKEISNLLLLIVGAKKNDQQKLMDLVKRNGAENWVDIIGWQPFDQIKGYILASKVCLVPHNNFEHTQTTVPHKLFQYMICGRPVIVSDCRPLSRIVKETKSGLVFKAGNSKDLAMQLVKLYNEPQILNKMGTEGRSSALGPYAWRHDSKRLTDMYSDLLAKNLSPTY